MSPTSSYPYSIAESQGFRPVSTEEWQKIWLDKVARELQKRNIPEVESHSHCTVIRRYLAAHPGNPRTIEIKKLKRFITAQKTDIRPSLILFYDAVARSEAHLEALNSVSITLRNRLPHKKNSGAQTKKRPKPHPCIKTGKKIQKAGKRVKKTGKTSPKNR
jgi:hypothetical protein